MANEEGLTEKVGVSGRRVARLGFGRVSILLGLVTASFDLFLVLTIQGFTFRIHQLCLLIALLAAIGLAYERENIRIPVGATWLGLWVCFILAFIPHTVLLSRSIGYALWLILDVLIVFSVVQLFGSTQWIDRLLRTYLMTFTGIGIFGFLQLMLGVMHLPAPFVTQWLIFGMWPRINGFSYEPSYFSTYMLLGWVFSAWLIEKKAFRLGRKRIVATFYVTSLSLLLSTSRIGWAMMLVWGLLFVVRKFSFKSRLRLSPVLILGALLMLSAPALLMLRPSADLGKAAATVAGGTGLFGTAAHSVKDRETNLQDTFELVKKSPFFGYSLGGVAPAIGVSRGLSILGNEDAKRNEGGTVLLEVLAASGVIGFCPFLLYMYSSIRKPLVASKRSDPETAAILSGLVWALCIELLALQFNQNVLRAYLWFHLGVLAAAYSSVQSQVRQVRPPSRESASVDPV